MTRMKKTVAFILVAAAGIGITYGIFQSRLGPEQANKLVRVERRDLVVAIQATGTVEPQNKVAISPPTNGRIDRLLVEEGTMVKAGQKIAEMSSTQRAALVDLAKTKGEKERKALMESYLPTAIFAPVDGLIISKQVVPGQTINQQTVLYEMSDRLIVRGQVDETDLGAIVPAMEADITVDAFPDTIYRARVTHIAHQSKVVDKISIYPVELEFAQEPAKLRSGMTANINFVVERKNKVLTLPVWTVPDDGSHKATVFTATGESQEIQLGISDGRSIEISGLAEGTQVSVPIMAMDADEKNTSPFSPVRRPRSSTNGKGGRNR